MWSGLADRAAFAREIAHDRFSATPATGCLWACGARTSCSCSSRATAGSRCRARPSRPASAPCSTRATRSCGPQASRRAAASSPRRPSAASAGWRTPPQSGVHVDGEQRYDELVENNRVTLTRAFKRAGGQSPPCRRTAGRGRRARPSTATTGSTTAASLGYRGPGLPPMPDQYTFRAATSRELAKRHRPPLFAEVDLISSHGPWTRIPGSSPGTTLATARSSIASRRRVHAALARRRCRAGPRRLRAFDRVLAARALLVRAALRRRQPRPRRPGRPSARDDRHRLGASHDVPISVIAHDPKVMDQIAGWGWRDGMLPGPAGAGLADGRIP